MHELSIALKLIDLAAEEARRQGQAEVVRIHVRLGPLSGVVKEALVSAYQLARDDTPLAAADLTVEEVPVIVFCPDCRAESPLASLQHLQCGRCGAATGRIVSGAELELVSLEMTA